MGDRAVCGGLPGGAGVAGTKRMARVHGVASRFGAARSARAVPRARVARVEGAYLMALLEG